MRAAWLIPGLVTAASAAALGWAFAPSRAGSAAMLGVIGGTYAVLGAATLAWLHRRGELKKQVMPQRGDVFIGALIALMLHLVARFATIALGGTSVEPWFMRVFLQLGDPRNTSVGIAVLGIAALEELVWRGWAMRVLALAHGERVGLFVSTALYGLVHVPTMFLLADPAVGPNPLLVTAALSLGLVWGYLALKIDRLGPSLVSHAIFSWSVVTFRLWSPG